MKKRLFIGIIGAASIALIAIFVTVIMRNGTEKESTRQIKVIDCSGACEVTRDGKTIAVEKDMDLVSNDVFKVSDDGFARIRLDDDKFLYLDRGTVIDITASGDADTSITAIFVHHGSMMTEVKNKLSPESAFTVVSANTTMHIKGTKTLTEVIEDAVTGHVQTSNAVLEGQVKIKAVKVKSDGTVVSVEKDLGAGEGNAFSSHKEELVSQEEMKSIAGNGFESAGLKIDIVTEEEAGVVFDVATFEESFLHNIKEVLVRDAVEAAGEEGLSQEEIDNINNTLDSVREAFEKIEALYQNKSDAQLDNSGKNEAKQEEPVKQPREDIAAIAPKDDTTEAAEPRRADTVNVAPPTNEEEAARKAAEEEAARKAAEEEAARKAAEEEAARKAAEEEAARKAAEEEAARQAAAEEAARRAAEEERRRQEQEAMLVSLSYQGLSKTVTRNNETVNLHLSFWMRDNEVEYQEVINYTLPNRLAKGTALPGIEIPGSNPDVIIWVSNENDVDDGFYFTGWYKSEEAANNNREDDRITIVPNDVTSLILYAGIEEIPDGNGSDPNSAGNGND